MLMMMRIQIPKRAELRIGYDDHEEKITSLEAKQQAITVGFTYIYANLEVV